MLSEWLLWTGGVLTSASVFERWCVAACIFTIASSGVACLARFEPNIERTFWIGTLLVLGALAVLFSQQPAIPIFVASIPATNGPLTGLGLVWAGGAAVLATLLVIRLAMLRLWIRALPRYEAAKLPLEVPDHVDIRSADHVSPFAFGVLRPSIVLPRSFSDLDTDVQRLVLMHELTHVQRRDWLWLLVGEIATTVLWFWPWAWTSRARLRGRIEESCDQAVVRASGNVERYVEALVETARRCRAQPPRHVAPVAQKLETRVGRLLRAHRLESPEDPEARVFWSLALPAIAAAILGSATLTEHSDWSRKGATAEAVKPAQLLTLTEPSGAIVQSVISCVGPEYPRPMAERPPEGSIGSVPQLGFRQPMSLTSPPPMEAAAPAASSPLISRTPHYPRRARERGLEGQVTIEYDIDAGGVVDNVRVTQSRPAGVFDTAAVAAINEFRYPRSPNGTTRKGMRQSFVFQLQSRI